MYISCINHKGGSYKVVVCIYHASIIKKEVIKLQRVYIMRNHKEGSYKVAVCIYHASIIKEEVIKLRCVYIIYQS